MSRRVENIDVATFSDVINVITTTVARKDPDHISWLTMLSRNSVGSYQKKRRRKENSHAARQGTLVHSRLSSPSQCGLFVA